MPSQSITTKIHQSWHPSSQHDAPRQATRTILSVSSDRYRLLLYYVAILVVSCGHAMRCVGILVCGQGACGQGVEGGGRARADKRQIKIIRYRSFFALGPQGAMGPIGAHSKRAIGIIF